MLVEVHSNTLILFVVESQLQYLHHLENNQSVLLALLSEIDAATDLLFDKNESLLLEKEFVPR